MTDVVKLTAAIRRGMRISSLGRIRGSLQLTMLRKPIPRLNEEYVKWNLIHVIRKGLGSQDSRQWFVRNTAEFAALGKTLLGEYPWGYTCHKVRGIPAYGQGRFIVTASVTTPLLMTWDLTLKSLLAKKQSGVQVEPLRRYYPDDAKRLVMEFALAEGGELELVGYSLTTKP